MKNNTLNIINFSNQITTKPLFTVKLADFGKSYPELDLFRQQVEWDKNHFLPMPFTSTKKKVITYKSIFLGIGLLFLVLAIFVYMKTLAHALALLMPLLSPPSPRQKVNYFLNSLKHSITGCKLRKFIKKHY